VRALLLPVAVLAPLLLACSEGARPAERAAVETAVEGAESKGPIDERILDQTVDRRLVVFVEASQAELEAVRAQYAEEDFGVVADDLMFYRSTAIEYLEERDYPLLRIEGRRPLRFRVSGSSRSLYEPDREPRVIAPNEVELATDYFAAPGPDSVAAGGA
jgi:hypothetical protein